MERLKELRGTHQNGIWFGNTSKTNVLSGRTAVQLKAYVNNLIRKGKQKKLYY